MVATRYRCSFGGASYPHTSGTGSSKRLRCAYCGSGFITETGLWGVFVWTAANRYPIGEATATFIHELSAEKAAKGLNQVVRWIPVDV